MNNLIQAKITIWGIVQGVGFRPFAAKLAARMDMRGTVCNTGGLVEIVVTDTAERIRAFAAALQAEKPLPAEIVCLKIQELGGGGSGVGEGRPSVQESGGPGPAAAPLVRPDDFVIAGSTEGDDRAAMIPSDLAFCGDCLKEMLDPEDPRFLHPFINCYACGPRYSIIDRIPYDRVNTAMVDFPMCGFCEKQYTDQPDRRFHAQTISCYHCGPVLRYHSHEPIPEEQALEASRKLIENFGETGMSLSDPLRRQSLIPLGAAACYLNDDCIIGFKGVGGYNLLCSPFSAQAVADLRNLKGREEKPFAVMFRDMEQIKKYCRLSETEEKLLLSAARPIVLLEKKGEPFCYDTCRTSRYVGAFLPSMGAQWMLIHLCGPLIVTSGNRSDFPIIRRDDEMNDWYDEETAAARKAGRQPLMAAVFYNDRDIRVSVDDSVVRVIDGQPQITRRSKGYAPVPLYLKAGEGTEAEAQIRLAGAVQAEADLGTNFAPAPVSNPGDAHIFAAGADLKNSFALSKGPFSYVSQYFGDLDSREIFDIYKWNQHRMADFFRIKPRLAVCDLHPLYRSVQFTQDYAEKKGIPLLQVQHHHAHTASVMAEHDLEGPVIGVSFDGTGYGADGKIWGGEFLICQGAEFRRAAHLEYVKMLGGDSSMKEGWKSALCWLAHLGLTSSRPEFPLVKAALTHGVNAIESSSMGRLFDAMASFLEIHHENRYEGECAILLENAAASAREAGISALSLHFEVRKQGGKFVLSPEPIFRELFPKKLTEETKKAAALGFHYAVADAITQICLEIRQAEGIGQVALSGGVFQNKILMEAALKKLREFSFRPYYNISVSPNDGGVCLGQNYIGMQYLKNRK